VEGVFTIKRKSSYPGHVIIDLDFYYKKYRIRKSTSLTIPKECWNKDDQRVNRKFIDYKRINRLLEDWENLIDKIIKEHPQGLTREQFINFLDLDFEKMSVFKFIRQQTAEFESLGKSAQRGFYNSMFLNFQGFRKGKDLEFGDISVLLLENWRKYNNKRKVSGKAYEGRFKHMLSEADRLGYSDPRNNPYKLKLISSNKFHKKQKLEDKEAIPSEQILILCNSEFPFPNMNEVRDYVYLIYVLGGIEPIDIFTLTPQDVENTRKDTDQLHFYKRRKTSRNLPISWENIPRAKQIINTWYEKRKEHQWLFPKMDGIKNPTEDKKLWDSKRRSINKTLKNMAKRLDFDPNIWNLKSIKHAFAKEAESQGVSEVQMTFALGHNSDAVKGFYLKRKSRKAAVQAGAVMQEMAKTIEEKKEP
jgi:hypothetical protein